jgi:hypothetical protein
MVPSRIIKQRRHQRRPRRHGLDLGQKPITAGPLCSTGIEDVIVPVRHADRDWPTIKSAFP